MPLIAEVKAVSFGLCFNGWAGSSLAAAAKCVDVGDSSGSVAAFGWRWFALNLALNGTCRQLTVLCLGFLHFQIHGAPLPLAAS